MPRSNFTLTATLLLTLTLARSAHAAPEVSASVIYEPNIAYWTHADGTQLELDVARPRNGAGPFPAVICIHGGGWLCANRTYARAMAIKLAQHGFVGVSISYRLAPKDRFPAQLHDAKFAVRWLRAHAEQYRVDKHQVAALGYSSGAQLACLLGLTSAPEHEGNGGHADQSSRVQAVISFYGITDLQRLHHKGHFLARLAVEKLLGGTPDAVGELCRQASPVHHVGETCPPILFIHGTHDALVPLEQSQLLRDQLERAGHRPALLNLKGADHSFDDKDGEQRDLAHATTLEFLTRNLARPAVAKGK